MPGGTEPRHRFALRRDAITLQQQTSRLSRATPPFGHQPPCCCLIHSANPQSSPPRWSASTLRLTTSRLLNHRMMGRFWKAEVGHFSRAPKKATVVIFFRMRVSVPVVKTTNDKFRQTAQTCGVHECESQASVPATLGRKRRRIGSQLGATASWLAIELLPDLCV
jgi:hypothetical protein